MQIIDKVNESGYSEWGSDFVKRVITKAKIKCKTIEIVDIEWSKRLFLVIDGDGYTIRTWNFEPISEDEKGNTNSELVQYTLFIDVDNGDGSGHGEEISCGNLAIKWENEY